jgi:hypothetical protein
MSKIKKEINWLKQYDTLRLMHLYLKGISFNLLGDCKDWKIYPKRYKELLSELHNVLYKAEEYTIKQDNKNEPKTKPE